jgi:hypothetical protein
VKKPTTYSLLALVAAIALSGCGSDKEGKPIPRAQAQALERRLDEVQRRFDAGGGACGDIDSDSRPAIEQLLGEIPASVDADVRQAARESFDRLFTLTAEQCDEQKGQDTTPETTPAPLPTPEPTTETQTQTQTQTQPAPPTTPGKSKKPKDENGKGGGAQGTPGNGGGGAAAPGGD